MVPAVATVTQDHLLVAIAGPAFLTAEVRVVLAGDRDGGLRHPHYLRHGPVLLRRRGRRRRRPLSDGAVRRRWAVGHGAGWRRHGGMRWTARRAIDGVSGD